MTSKKMSEFVTAGTRTGDEQVPILQSADNKLIPLSLAVAYGLGHDGSDVTLTTDPTLVGNSDSNIPSEKAIKSYVGAAVAPKADTTYVDTSVGPKADKTYVDSELSAKQPTLVSGTNIKTVNGSSLLGSGNISIAGREILGTSRTYYVSTGGNDANNGLSIGASFLTVQHAVNVACNEIDAAGFDVTIIISDGTYNEAVILGNVMGAASVQLVGNTATPSNVVIDSTSLGSVIAALDISTTWSVGGFKAVGADITMTRSNLIVNNDVVFDSTLFCFTVWSGSVLEIDSTITVLGAGETQYAGLDMLSAIAASESSEVHFYGTLECPNGNTFTEATVQLDSNSTLDWNPASTGVGVPVGKRFALTRSSSINANNLGLTSIPGSIAGTLDDSSSYDGVLGYSSAPSSITLADAGGYYGTPKDLETVLQLLGKTYVKQAYSVAASDESTPLTTGTAKITFRMPYGMTITEIRGSLSTAQTSGSLLQFDVKKNGTTIFTTKPTFDNTEKTTKTAITAPVISTSSLSDDDEITIDITQLGDGTAKGLKVTFIGKIA